MIRTLRRKFIFTAMLAVTILLVGLLGSINVINTILNARQTDMRLDMLLAEESSPIPQMPPKFGGGEEHGFLRFPLTENTRMSSVYFVVRTDPDGTVVQTNVSRIATVTEEQATSLAQTVQANGNREGRISGFRYRSASLPNDVGTVWLFLDTSEQANTTMRLFLLSVLIGIACWLAMFLIVFLLSARAIRPIAANLERQRQFVTDAGHEIKTPLAIIGANTEAMELHNGESKWSRNIREQVIRLNGLMQNLLTLAKIDEINVSLTREPLSLSALTEEGSDMFREAMELKHLQVERRIQPDLTVNANRDLMSRLISILMDNALKYTPTGGSVVIELFRTDKAIQLVVANECENLPNCPAEKLFDRFYRADPARTQKSGGYGIGLSAAQSIVEAHGGNISALYRDEHTIAFFVTVF